jgi:protein-tyrosine phosphatase
LFDKILILCTANICRSPLAEVAMRKALKDSDRHAQTRSAGINALVGHPADPDAQTIASRHGMDLSDHRAVQVDRDLLHWANLILVMEDAHRAELRSRDPDSSGKVLLLGHWVQSQIPDPYLQGLDMFEQTMTLIQRSVACWIERI